MMVSIFYGSSVFAQQITLLHTFDERELNGTYPHFSYHMNDYIYANSTDSYIYVDASVNDKGYYSYERDEENYTYTYTTYNNDFSIKNKSVYAIQKVENYNLNSVSLFKTLFDDDETTTEILVTYEHEDGYNASANIRKKCILYDEQGGIIYDFGTARMFGTIYYLHYVENEFRLWIEYMYDYSAEETEQTGKYSYSLHKIFKVNKRKTTGLQQVPAKMFPYPNPANSNINIPLNNNGGMLNIYDLNGRKVESICPTGNYINLNVSNYPSGQYIYEQNGNTNRFIVQ